MLGGYMGKIARVNLSTGVVEIEPINEELAKKFIGARGYAAKIIFDEVPRHADPLGPENKLIFATGPLTLTTAPTGGRYDVVTKSPLNNVIAASNSGGFFGPELKKAGFDMLIVEGKSNKPVYLWVHDGNVEIRDASHLWGKDTYETTDMLLEEVGDKTAKVACIGPAGEKLSMQACVINDKARAAGRTGVGAVMGSKMLKAVVAKGNLRAPIADNEAFKEALRVAMDKIKTNGVTSQGLPTYGTMVLNHIIDEHGLYPTNNFQKGTFEYVDEVSGEKLKDTYLIRNKACFACPIGCGRVVRIPEIEEEVEGPEYETSWAFSADCGVKDLKAVITANHLCNKLGLDTIATGATIAALMELYEKGYVPKEHIGDLPEPKFGNASAIVEYTKAIGLRIGIGDKLAKGSYEFASEYGHPELSMSVRKQELPAYDPRGAQGHALEYATSNRGGCHVRGYMISPEILGVPEKLDPFATDGKAQWVKTFQDLTAVIDSEGLCLFTSFALGLSDYTAMLKAATGFDYTEDEVMKAGERIWNLERLWNIDLGVGPEEDKLPERFIKEPLPDGASKGQVVRLDLTLPDYYKVRGWDEKGYPKEEKLRELGLK
ncbi:aldehyde ferredoxin oxidoreductase family protein [Caldisericum exile]|uniref:Tungsten-containing aldehyde ferredoxin oxidoreductase n=1 Tax=Caldisericum exile (strain DSM 21853 / NBRC 104410 / AZM16c01) TaxID=511051 RepID=A0A7U6JGF4_CALEA|nr:tungsten-containing aldehyde ferredoxin oxidoreductase [Caldisericum exile AZM16c01]